MEKLDLNLKISFNEETSNPNLCLEFVPFLDADNLHDYKKYLGFCKDNYNNNVYTKLAIGIMHKNKNFCFQFFDTEQLLSAIFVVIQGKTFMFQMHQYDNKLTLKEYWETKTGLDAIIDAQESINSCSEQFVRQQCDDFYSTLYCSNNDYNLKLAKEIIENESDYFNDLQNIMFSSYLNFCYIVVASSIIHRGLTFKIGNKKLQKLLNQISLPSSTERELNKYVRIVKNFSIQQLDELCNAVSSALESKDVFKQYPTDFWGEEIELINNANQ